MVGLTADGCKLMAREARAYHSGVFPGSPSLPPSRT
jgi:hypothetical protein